MITKMINQAELKRLKTLLEKARKVAITCHICPDGDALGSSLGLASVLSGLGKDVTVISPDSPTKSLSFLPGFKEIIDGNRYADYARRVFTEADLIFCLDFNGLKRIDRLAAAMADAKAPRVLIDHHLYPEDFAAVTLSYPTMASTCELLYRTLCGLGLYDAIDRAAATCMLAGMMTDTGNFTYNANNPEEYVIVAELVRKGADREVLYKRLFNTFSASCLRLNGYAMSEKYEQLADGRAALITLTREELNRFNYSKGDTEGLVNRPLAVPGTICSCFLREEEHQIKVSMRSVDTFGVDSVCARYFNGGGHKNAAGGEFKGTMEECATIFREHIAAELDAWADKKS